MGTSGSYSGSGGKAGSDLRDEIGSWFDSLQSPSGDDSTTPDGDDVSKPGVDRPRLRPEALLNAVPFLRPGGRTGSGSGVGGIGGAARSGSTPRSSGGGTGGPRRAIGRSAATAGRAAAAAYAYGSADAPALERLGLDYEELRNLDALEVTRRIVDAACGPRSNSTIEDHEQRYVAAEVAEWILERSEGGAPPSPEEAVRQTIAVIIAEIVDSEIGELLRNDEKPVWASELAETEIREASEVLASKAELTVTGATEEEFTQAIESGIETLRHIVGGSA